MQIRYNENELDKPHINLEFGIFSEKYINKHGHSSYVNTL